MNEHWINKLDVARVQIAEAIRIFFAERDKIVVHTIIASAHQILADVGQNKDIYGALKNPTGKDKKEYREYLKKINSPYNFFKHADKDTSGKINIAPIDRFTQDFIMDSIVLLQTLSGELPLEAKVYWHWFVCSYPEEFDDCPEGGMVKEMMKSDLHKLDFPTLSQFIEMGGFGT